MKLTDMFPSNLLKSQDVMDEGGELVLQIFKVELHEFDGDNGDKERKPILIFKDDRRMVLNKTNANTIAGMFGDDTDLWLNKEITLVVQDVQFRDKMVPAIRIKNVNSKQAAVDTFWTKARELGFTREDGLNHLKQFGNPPDFKAALEALEGEPFATPA